MHDTSAKHASNSTPVARNSPCLAFSANGVNGWASKRCILNSQLLDVQLIHTACRGTPRGGSFRSLPGTISRNSRNMSSSIRSPRATSRGYTATGTAILKGIAAAISRICGGTSRSMQSAVYITYATSGSVSFPAFAARMYIIASQNSSPQSRCSSPNANTIPTACSISKSSPSPPTFFNTSLHTSLITAGSGLYFLTGSYGRKIT
mmetsp:Transcript_11651/g.29461  ORF Transcript_11651/g.29461 Transcript_11651/m.29461 type:complete len:206 (+) Transcript_11651:853-1470(+)